MFSSVSVSFLLSFLKASVSYLIELVPVNI